MTTELEPAGKPEFEQVADEYRLRWANGIEASVERIVEHRDELTAEITIRSSRLPRPGYLTRSRLNLMATQTRKALVTTLREREADLDWHAMVEQMCFLVADAYREGEPSIDMRSYERSTGTRWLLEPFIERGGPTILFADGGTGKSTVALAMAVSMASGEDIIGRRHGAPVPVLYLDWEAGVDDTQNRIEAICVGAGIDPRDVPINYRRQVASLAEGAASNRREISRLGAGLVVIDPFGAARGGDPESAEVTIKSFSAIRSFGVPVLIVDHVTKREGNDATKPFGSVFTSNSARQTWKMDRGREEDRRGGYLITMDNPKQNNVRRASSLGFRITHEAGEDDWVRSITIRPDNDGIANDPDLSKKLPLRVRILSELRQGPLEQTDVATNLGADANAVRVRVNEMVKRGELVRLEDKRVALAARTG